MLLLPSFWLLLASIFRVVGMRPVDETSGGSGAKLREVAMAARRDESQKRNRNLVEAIAGHKMCLTKPNLTHLTNLKIHKIHLF